MSGVRRTGGLATALAAAVLAVAPAGASAAITNLELVEAEAVEQPASATCPAGELVVGAGGTLSSTDGQVTFRNIRPRADLTGVDVQGLEDETGAPDGWTATAFAFCATPPPGLERIAATSASSSAPKTVGAQCAAGKSLLGVGGEIAGGGGQVAIEDMIPGAGVTSVTVSGGEDENGYAGSWTVTAYAVCADTVAGVARVFTNTPPGSDPREAIVACPAGKQLLGLAGAQHGLAGMVLRSLAPDADLEGGVVASVEDEDGTANSWSVTGYGICAPTAQLVQASTSASSSFKTKTATCPAGTTLTGGGGDITSGGGTVLMNELFPNQSQGFRASGDYFWTEPPAPYLTRWRLRAFAICTSRLDGLELVSATGAYTDYTYSTLEVTCPAGKQVVGGGGRVSEGDGEIMVDQIEPDPALTQITVSGNHHEGGVLPGLWWRLYGYALCATPPPGLELVTAVEVEPAGSTLSATASCPAGKHVLGAGGTIFPPSGKVVLRDVRPHSTLTGVTATGQENPDGATGDWNVEAHAICASR